MLLLGILGGALGLAPSVRLSTLKASCFSGMPAARLTSASTRPNSMLQLRGGARTLSPRMIATEIGVGVLASTGLLAWAFPDVNLPGFDGYDSATKSIVRAIGAWQLCYSFVLCAGSQVGPAVASSSLLAAAATIMAILPVWDTLGRERPSQVVTAAVFAVLGVALRSVSPYLAAAAYLLPGTLIYATPTKSTAELYRLASPLSPLASSMLKLYGASIGFVGIYLAALGAGLAHSAGFAAALIANALVSLRWAATEASGLRAPKAGAIAWAAISAILAALSVVA